MGGDNPHGAIILHGTYSDIVHDIPFQKESSKSAANHFLGRVYGEKLSCACNGIGSISMIRRDLPIPGLYEMIPTFGAS